MTSTVVGDREFTFTTRNFGAREETITNLTSPGFAAFITMRCTGFVPSGDSVRVTWYLLGMEKTVYDRRSFRNLPRERCELEHLFGPIIGPCKGLIHLHHTDPDDPESRLLQICASHHSKLHAALRALLTPSEPEWKTCHHIHRTAEGKAACERRLNRVDRAAAA